MTTVIVTGGTSAPGRLVLQSLVSRGDRVLATARSEAAAASLAALGAVPVHFDLDSTAACPVGKADLLLHVAGVRHATGAHELAGGWNVAAAVCVSSASATAVGHPLRDMILTAEETLLNAEIPWHIVRPTMIFGAPRDRNLRVLTHRLTQLRFAPRLAGGGLVQPVFVDDVAASVLEVGDRAVDGDAQLSQVLALGGTRRLTLGELIDDLARLLRLRRLPVAVPIARLARLAQLSGATSRSRAAHAIAMLLEDRVVEHPNSIGLRHTPMDWSAALEVAVRRYGY